MPPSHNRPRVGLLIQSSLEYGRALLRGIGQYVAEHGPWNVYHRSGALLARLPDDFRAWRPDAVLAQLESPTLLRQVRALRVPTIDLFASRALPGIPQLLPDHCAVSRLVADYFLERGYRQFAYCGFQGVHYVELRRRHFVDYLTARGFSPAVYESPPRERRPSVFAIEAAGQLETAALGRWLQTLAKPLALMAGSDIRAQQVLSACREVGIAVPDEVAVAGVGDDQVVCRLCDPRLSSVDLNTEEIGYRAAELLARMLRGGRAPVKSILVAPRGIVARESTQARAVTDPDVVAALQFIQERYGDGLSVDQVAAHVALSRSTLQRRFAKALGRTPQAQIHQQQLQRVQQLLADTDFALARIATLAGFRHVESLCRLFKRHTGRTPGAVRGQRRGRPAAGDRKDQSF